LARVLEGQVSAEQRAEGTLRLTEARRSVNGGLNFAASAATNFLLLAGVLVFEWLLERLFSWLWTDPGPPAPIEPTVKIATWISCGVFLIHIMCDAARSIYTAWTERKT
jgi:hypothetical protein